MGGPVAFEGGVGLGGGQGGCEQRIKVFFGGSGGGSGGVGGGGGVGSRLGGSGWGDQGGCEQRIEVFVKNLKKNEGGGGQVGGRVGGGVRVLLILDESCY